MGWALPVADDSFKISRDWADPIEVSRYGKWMNECFLSSACVRDRDKVQQQALRKHFGIRSCAAAKCFPGYAWRLIQNMLPRLGNFVGNVKLNSVSVDTPPALPREAVFPRWWA